MSKANDENTEVKDLLGSEVQRKMLKKTMRYFTLFVILNRFAS
jgi:hypothetical protein